VRCLTILAIERQPQVWKTVTNCSRQLGQIAANKVGVKFACVITAESTGWYKPDPRPYQMALNTLAIAADRCLFVAVSAYDLFGTAKVGIATSWHNRKGSTLPDEAPPPLAHERTLSGLPRWGGLRCIYHRLDYGWPLHRYVCTG